MLLFLLILLLLLLLLLLFVGALVVAVVVVAIVVVVVVVVVLVVAAVVVVAAAVVDVVVDAVVDDFFDFLLFVERDKPRKVFLPLIDVEVTDVPSWLLAVRIWVVDDHSMLTRLHESCEHEELAWIDVALFFLWEVDEESIGRVD